MPLLKARLLLVDDDTSVIRLMSRTLTRYPDQRFATSGAQALALARETPPDLILLDNEMPGMSGLEVCAALKRDPALRHIPVILVTSDDAIGREAYALQLGAADVLTRPLVAERLQARVAAQLRSLALVEQSRAELVAGTVQRLSSAGGLTRILLVDDDVGAIQRLRHTLHELGDLHFAESGTVALRLADLLSPDIVVLDACMPDFDGFQVCLALKSDARFRHVPIVFVTQLSDLQHETTALGHGATDFISKPYTHEILKARVQNLLGSKRRVDAELLAERARRNQT